jgi:hypothetical protein
MWFENSLNELKVGVWEGTYLIGEHAVDGKDSKWKPVVVMLGRNGNLSE